MKRAEAEAGGGWCRRRGEREGLECSNEQRGVWLTSYDEANERTTTSTTASSSHDYVRATKNQHHKRRRDISSSSLFIIVRHPLHERSTCSRVSSF